MTLTRPLTMAFLAFALLTIGLKVAFENRVGYARLNPTFLAEAEAALRGQGFEILRKPGNLVVGGVKDACLLWVGPARPEGGDDDYLTLTLGSLGRIGYWYRGTVAEERPVIGPLLDRYKARFLSAFGSTIVAPPLYFVAYAKECAPETVSGLGLRREPEAVD
ncbi:hypothetical protein [Prosthecomicrobium sp. N25]|uniref:hypothetical protein n=1 Tax=Prosthecomicrobium sp. N25 TaxID=3129254 RepID=UPI0030788625